LVNDRRTAANASRRSLGGDLRGGHWFIGTRNGRHIILVAAVGVARLGHPTTVPSGTAGAGADTRMGDLGQPGAGSGPSALGMIKT